MVNWDLEPKLSQLQYKKTFERC